MNPFSSAPGHWQRSFAASSAHSSGATAILEMGKSQVVTQKNDILGGLNLPFPTKQANHHRHHHHNHYNRLQ